MSAATAKIRHVRMTPRKMRAIANHVRGMQAGKAVEFLTFCRRRAARPILKLIRSAIANADQKGDVDVDNLKIEKIEVDGGPTLKRWMPRARGMATPVLKRTSHVRVVLEEV
jgi:large subunit ribosomal protein L22